MELVDFVTFWHLVFQSSILRLLWARPERAKKRCSRTDTYWRTGFFYICQDCLHQRQYSQFAVVWGLVWPVQLLKTDMIRAAWGPKKKQQKIRMKYAGTCWKMPEDARSREPVDQKECRAVAAAVLCFAHVVLQDNKTRSWDEDRLEPACIVVFQTRFFSQGPELSPFVQSCIVAWPRNITTPQYGRFRVFRWCLFLCKCCKFNCETKK